MNELHFTAYKSVRDRSVNSPSLASAGRILASTARTVVASHVPPAPVQSACVALLSHPLLAPGEHADLTPHETLMEMPLTVVIFGATGDLARKKLFPALYQLCLLDHLPRSLRIVGYGRTPVDLPAFVAKQCVTGPHVVHCHTVHLPLGALLIPCTMCGAGGYTYYHIWQVSLTCLVAKETPLATSSSGAAGG